MRMPAFLWVFLALCESPPPPGAPLIECTEPSAVGERSAQAAVSDLAQEGRLELRPPLRLHPRELVGYGSALGALMAIVAWAWFVLLRGGRLATWFPGDAWLLDLLIGTGVGVLFTAIAWMLQGRVRGLRRVSNLLMMVLDMQALRPHHALVFGLMAGLPEELLFRGAMQPVFGLLLTAIFFGALHAATTTYYVYATIAGLMLGVLAEWRGGLWAPIAAHTVIDMLMFLLLLRAWRRGQGPLSGSRV